jgi:hypothetical protein
LTKGDAASVGRTAPLGFRLRHLIPQWLCDSQFYSALARPGLPGCFGSCGFERTKRHDVVRRKSAPFAGSGLPPVTSWATTLDARPNGQSRPKAGHIVCRSPNSPKIGSSQKGGHKEAPDRGTEPGLPVPFGGNLDGLVWDNPSM